MSSIVQALYKYLIQIQIFNSHNNPHIVPILLIHEEKFVTPSTWKMRAHTGFRAYSCYSAPSAFSGQADLGNCGLEIYSCVLVTAW